MEVLLAGSVGALSVFLLGLFREWWRDERERRGLMRLLSADISHNAQVIGPILEALRSPVAPSALPSTKTDTWRDVRTRAVQLLPGDVFETLDRYYSPLEVLQTVLRSYERGEVGRIHSLFRNHGDAYVDRFADTLREGSEASDAIARYLGMTWAEHLLVDNLRLLERVKRGSGESETGVKRRLEER